MQFCFFSSEERLQNLQVHLSAADLLVNCFDSLKDLVLKNSRGLSSFVSDLLSRCLVQKVTLRTLWISLYGITAAASIGDGNTDRQSVLGEDFGFTGKLLDFNTQGEEKYWAVLQTQVLRIVESLIVLEYHLHQFTRSASSDVTSPLRTPNSIHWSASRRAALLAAESGTPLAPWHFVHGSALVRQPMFEQLIAAALREVCLNAVIFIT